MSEIIPHEANSIGLVANQVASQYQFRDYRNRKAKTTISRQDSDLALFGEYLALMGIRIAYDLATEPEAWIPITWGLISGFVQWQLGHGYSTTTVNVRLSTVRTYARLAFKAGAISHQEHVSIQAVHGYSHREGTRLDRVRKRDDIPTRFDRPGAKKSEPTLLTDEQARFLKEQHEDTPQGRRDALLIAVMLDHGLRCGEVAALKVKNFNLSLGKMTFYRPKVDLIQTHRLTAGAHEAARRYYLKDVSPNPDAPLLRASLKNGELGHEGMTERGITKRVRILGEEIGVFGLSAHDLRHYWATKAANSGTPLDRLQQAGGWSSLNMPLRYIKAAEIANSGILLTNVRGKEDTP
jgi:integrase